MANRDDNRNDNRGKMSPQEAGRKGGKAPHSKRGRHGSDKNRENRNE